MIEGRLIVFEGPDGVGKSTLVQKTIEFLQVKNVALLGLSFPGKIAGTLGNLIDKLHHARSQFEITEITPLALQALHVAAHLDTIEGKIIPALKTGVTVILDRTWWSTWIYGKLANVNEDVLLKLIEAEQMLWADIKPDVMFVIQRDTAFKPEHTQEAFTQLSRLYEQVAALEQHLYPITVIHNNDLLKSLLIVQESIRSFFPNDDPQVN